MSTSHTIKDVSIFNESWLHLVHKEMGVRTKPVCKNFGDDIKDDIEETNKAKLINHRSTLFLRNESYQSKIETLEVYNAIV